MNKYIISFKTLKDNHTKKQLVTNQESEQLAIFELEKRYGVIEVLGVEQL